MGKKKKILIVFCTVLLLAVNVLILFHKGNIGGEYQFQIELSAEEKQNIQIYYSDVENSWSESASQTQLYEKSGKVQVMNFVVPSTHNYMRVDFGKEEGTYFINNMTLSYEDTTMSMADVFISSTLASKRVENITAAENSLLIVVDGEDAYIQFQVSDSDLYPLLERDCVTKTTILNILMLLFIDGAAVLALVFRKKFGTLPIELYQNRGLILNLAKNDFKTKYAGSYLGIVWAFIQPIITILVYWFVFSVGFKSGMASNYPFVLYLVTGMVPWFFFQDALNGGTNALIEYSYLVKKVVFKISILPIVKVISALFVHAFFVLIALILACLYGYFPGVEVIQVVYYSICNFVMVLGLVYATSAVVIFFRDLSQIISIFLQIGVWLTPIMWDLNMLAGNPLLMKIFKLNPMYYIVSGYRDAILGKVWFWEHWGWTLYFWVVISVLFVLGTVIFKRLKPHFADVL